MATLPTAEELLEELRAKSWEAGQKDLQEVTAFAKEQVRACVCGCGCFGGLGLRLCAAGSTVSLTKVNWNGSSNDVQCACALISSATVCARTPRALRRTA
jgi:hypothetical protein